MIPIKWIDIANRCGYDGVEIRMIRGESALHTLEEFRLAQIGPTLDKFKRHGLEVVCISTGVRFTSLDREEFKEQQDLTRLNVDIAVGLGAKCIRVFGGPLPKNQDRAETFKRIREWFSLCGSGLANAMECKSFSRNP